MNSSQVSKIDRTENGRVISFYKNSHKHIPSSKLKFKRQRVLRNLFHDNHAEIVNLNTLNLPGTPIIVQGKVCSGIDKNQPVKNAKIEIWHADDNGAYHEGRIKNGHNYFTSKITLSGSTLTDEMGVYSFKSIVPGLYGYRARHFHYRISAKRHTTLETQIYFKDDPRIHIDDKAITAEACRIIDFENNGYDELEGTVNIYLPKI